MSTKAPRKAVSVAYLRNSKKNQKLTALDIELQSERSLPCPRLVSKHSLGKGKKQKIDKQSSFILVCWLEKFHQRRK